MSAKNAPQRDGKMDCAIVSKIAAPHVRKNTRNNQFMKQNRLCLLAGGMAFSPFCGILGLIFFPILCGQIGSGFGYNPGYCGKKRATHSKTTKLQLFKKTWVGGLR